MNAEVDRLLTRAQNFVNILEDIHPLNYEKVGWDSSPRAILCVTASRVLHSGSIGITCGAKKKKVLETMKQHHHWETSPSLTAKYNPDDTSDNKKQPSSVGLSIYSFLTSSNLPENNFISVVCWVTVHYLLFYSGWEWNRGISMS